LNNFWCQQPLGIEVASLEIQQLQPILEQLSGQYLLQLGDSELLNHIQLKRIAHRAIITPHIVEQCQHNNALCASYTELPFTNGSADVMLLPHVLEFASAPQTVLAESWRVLADDGQLIIIGFNPWSLWGLWRLLSPKNAAPWSGRFHDVQKWRKQIKHLNGSIVFFKYFFFRPPINNQNFLQQTGWLDKALQLLFPAAGGIYLLVAQKQIVPLSPIKAKFNWSKLLLAPKGLEPTTRGAQRGR
jgi:SAM-dependent methyltransferase